MSSNERSPAPAPRPARVTAAAAVTGLEALALVAGGVYVLVNALVGTPDGFTQALTGGATLVALGLIPLLAARGLLLCRSWSRGPAVITQIMALPVAYTLLTGAGAAVPAGIALAVAAVAALVLLVHPATTRALGITGRTP
ncbi:hypothetical protein LUW75_06330 [Streptomyces sp. MRC013]|uniref:hypothetical protein n=1 Tax=Streptomyces sp. MRC013 TaxID=2898276 RepID=UPI002026A855|nr:hypothetical protein [Streptomyces sp. MRC013]URM89673.1 hypothetical protein LUW75_06330 [Streptomyces sp. MRC013]